MPTLAYSFRLKRVVPLLSEEEWAGIADLLRDRLRWIEAHRQETGRSLDEARRTEPVGQAALDRYEEMTGLRLDHPDQLYSVRRSDHGALCPACGKPFRTPRAKMCAACGFVLPAGMVAGVLGEVGH